jgi:hypothetical protein
VAEVVHQLERTPIELAIWLAYNAFHDRNCVDEVVARAKNEHGVDIQPIVMP